MVIAGDTNKNVKKPADIRKEDDESKKTNNINTSSNKFTNRSLTNESISSLGSSKNTNQGSKQYIDKHKTNESIGSTSSSKNTSKISLHSSSTSSHCNRDGCMCNEAKCCKDHCDSDSEHCMASTCGCSQDNCCKTHCSTTKTVPDFVYYDSLVKNEKSYLDKILKQKIYNKEVVSMNPCLGFFNWILHQFEKEKVLPPLPSLILGLNHLQGMVRTKNLFVRNVTPDDKVDLKEEIDFDNVDVYSLAEACKEEIDRNVEIFDEELEMKLKNLYQSNNEKIFVLKRVPFVIKNRDVFKAIKKIMVGQDRHVMNSSVPLDISVDMWSRILLKRIENQEVRNNILNDIIRQEFDVVPLSFYD